MSATAELHAVCRPGAGRAPVEVWAPLAEHVALEWSVAVPDSTNRSHEVRRDDMTAVGDGWWRWEPPADVEGATLDYAFVLDGDEPAETAGFRRIVVTEPGHPYVGAWWPAGHGLGYEHGFTHQVVDLVTAIAKGEDPTPSFADGLQVQRVLDAVERSAAARSVWTEI